LTIVFGSCSVLLLKVVMVRGAEVGLLGLLTGHLPHQSGYAGLLSAPARLCGGRHWACKRCRLQAWVWGP
jgi:hypothetical protein